jgi:hypothetical protein
MKSDYSRKHLASLVYHFAQQISREEQYRESIKMHDAPGNERQSRESQAEFETGLKLVLDTLGYDPRKPLVFAEPIAHADDPKF